MAKTPYEEFSMLHENAAEWSLPVPVDAAVERITVPVEPGRHLSALRWGHVAPRLVLLHGGAQNAHTFDTVALAMRCPLLAVDLPGHGHSDAAPGGLGDVPGHARAVAAMLGALGLAHLPVVGMSLGGLVALQVTVETPEVVSRLAMIDVTPGVIGSRKAQHITEFVNGPASFADLDELVARTVEHNPTRSESSLRRGVLHNAVELDDGTWVWRHQRHPAPENPPRTDPEALWASLGQVGVPVLLVRAMGPGSVVDDADESEFLRCQPTARVVHVEGSGHSVQGDQPLELARILAEFIDG